RAIARPLGITFEVWGAEPKEMPATRALQVSLELVKWPVDRAFIVGQESWSDAKEEPYEWAVSFFRTVGQRAPYSHVRFPPAGRKDGVFFFPFQKKLRVWPKAQMDAGVIQMLRVAGLIDEAMAARLEARGFRPLKTTLTGP